MAKLCHKFSKKCAIFELILYTRRNIISISPGIQCAVLQQGKTLLGIINVFDLYCVLFCSLKHLLNIMNISVVHRLRAVPQLDKSEH